MSWWGKLAGGGLGFALGGPIGALVGAVLGHQLDKSNQPRLRSTSFDPGAQERVQAVFFATTFSVMGHIAKVDGRVSPHEIQLAEQVIAHMRLSKEQRRAAIDFFNKGKEPSFNLDEVLAQFRKECRRRIALLQMFIEIQLQAAYADGAKDVTEDKVLRHICEVLGYPQFFLTQLEAMLRAQRHNYQYSNSTDRVDRTNQLQDAYKILGVPSSSSDDEVKKAYRRLMAQHHPDKLIAKGLPEEMIALATDKTQQIQKAYDLIKSHRQSM